MIVSRRLSESTDRCALRGLENRSETTSAPIADSRPLPPRKSLTRRREPREAQRSVSYTHLDVYKRQLVFTNGVFDVLHRGHVTYLEKARALGLTLRLGLNTDSSVRQLDKGSDRPLNAEHDRAMVIAALESVSCVTTFAERTPVDLISLVRPDIYVKGGDYDIELLEDCLLYTSRCV